MTEEQIEEFSPFWGEDVKHYVIESMDPQSTDIKRCGIFDRRHNSGVLIKDPELALEVMQRMVEAGVEVAQIAQMNTQIYRDFILNRPLPDLAPLMDLLDMLSPQELTNTIQAFLRDSHPEVRARGIQIAYEWNLDNLSNMVIPLLDDPVYFVRCQACKVLHFNSCIDSVSKIRDLLLSDPDPLVRAEAAAALGTLGTIDDIPFMCSAAQIETGVNHEDSPISYHIMQAVQKIQDRHQNLFAPSPSETQT